MVATSDALWARGDEGTLSRFDADSLTPLDRDVLPGTSVTDIANAGRGQVFALVRHDERWQAIRIDCAGHAVDAPPIEFQGITNVEAFAYLRAPKHFVLLADDHLHWFSPTGRALFSLPVASFSPCLQATVLGSDSTDKVMLAGTSSGGGGGGTRVVIIDADGSLLGELGIPPADEKVTGIAATRDRLFVAGRRGVLRFSRSDAAAETAGGLSCVAVTPMLESSPDDGTPPWRRVEVRVSLPEACSLEITALATDDPAVRTRLKRLMENASLPSGTRVAALLSDPDLRRSRLVIHGSERGAKGIVAAAPLNASRERYLCVCLELSAGPGAKLPAAREMEVLYQGDSLMNDLPAIYRRDAESVDSFIRSLVGVFEATTQDLDARIASIGRLIHPSSAPEAWLDIVARWLGVPWDDGLELEQKRCILTHAERLTAQRGTRGGLEQLLACITSGSGSRFRVTDSTVDFGFAVVGGAGSHAGARLPAILAGPPQRRAVPDARVVLGATRLAYPPELQDPAARFVGQIRVDVAATAQQRVAWEPWLHSLIREMAPLGTRVSLRWVSAAAMRGRRLDETSRLEDRPTPHLGTDAILGSARLPQRASPLSKAGHPIGMRLQ
jgi:phage tail-like protein